MPCSICVHESVESIDAALEAGQALRSVALSHGVSRSSLVRHTQHKAMSATGPPAAGAPVAEVSVQPSMDWSTLMEQAALLHVQTQFAAGTAGMLQALRNVSALLPYVIEALAASAGVACPVPPGHLPPKFPQVGRGMPGRSDWQMVGRNESANT